MLNKHSKYYVGILGIFGIVIVAGAIFGLSYVSRNIVAPLPAHTEEQLSYTPQLQALVYKRIGELLEQSNVKTEYRNATPTPSNIPPDKNSIAAFLYNSAPCIEKGKTTTYRIAIHNIGETPVTSMLVHFVYPDGITIEKTGLPPSDTDIDQRSYFWRTSTHLKNTYDFYSFTISATPTKTQDLAAQLIATYTLEGSTDTHQTISERVILACE